jgi:CubicO group peptidase (beta-lactamase class C family)
MNKQTPRRYELSRRAALRVGAGATLGVAVASALPRPSRAAKSAAVSAHAGDADDLFRELDAKIEAAMARYHIPGVAVGLLYQGREYVRGYGVTNVDAPQPVDGDTLFRIASTTKTFTGTTVMRLLDERLLDLDAPVRRYLPDFRVSDEAASAQVTLRQCLNHSAGWLGDDAEDFGQGDDALARYIAGMVKLPQLTPPGTQFAYNNPAIDVAGRVVEVVTGRPYEDAVQEMLLDPLGLDNTRFFTDQLAGCPIAGSHSVAGDRAVFEPDLWYYARSWHPDGGLISSARDQLRWVRFHIGDGRAADGTRLLARESLAAMRSNPGPGGTLVAEIDGIGVAFQLRRTAEGVRVVQHGGDWQGQHSGFFFVPERDFALTVLTNSTGGPRLILELFYDDWALQRFAGLHNPPAVPAPVPVTQLGEYEGVYLGRSLEGNGELEEAVIRLHGRDGALRGTLEQAGEGSEIGFEFYRGEYVLVVTPNPTPPGSYRGNFVRGPDGRVAWLTFAGRLYARQPS